MKITFTVESNEPLTNDINAKQLLLLCLEDSDNNDSIEGVSLLRAGKTKYRPGPEACFECEASWSMTVQG